MTAVLNLGEKARRACRTIFQSKTPVYVYMFEDGVRTHVSDGVGDKDCLYPVTALVGAYDDRCTWQDLHEDLEDFHKRNISHAKINAKKVRIHGGTPKVES